MVPLKHLLLQKVSQDFKSEVKNYDRIYEENMNLSLIHYTEKWIYYKLYKAVIFWILKTIMSCK